MSLLPLVVAATLAAAPCPVDAPTDARCITAGEHLLLLGPDDDPAPILADLDDAIALFERHFEQPPVPTAIATVPVTAELSLSLDKAGYRATLPWVGEAQIVEQVRRQVGARLDEDTVRALVAQHVERLRQNKPVTHELGHVWLIAGYWPDARRPADAEPPRELRYGGPGPDWLDELAAVATEGPRLIDARRSSFRKRVAGGRLPSLESWLTTAHPLLRTIEANRQLLASGATTGESAVTVLSGDAARALIEQATPPADDPTRGITPTMFYDIARGMVDFLDAHADRPPYDALARHIAAGGTLASWLAADGESYGLPATVPAFEDAFRTWAAASAATADTAPALAR